MEKVNMKNIFITGNKQTGKSTLINNIISNAGLDCSGFLTLPYHIGGKRRGYYLHGVAGIPDEENDVPITAQPDGSSFYAINETFENLGVRILKSSLQDKSKIIVMDEIGVAEGCSRDFIRYVENCLDSNKFVLGVLKQSDCSHIHKIKNRRDVLVFVLEGDNHEYIYNKILKLIIKREIQN